jgi:hypothetical protein
VGQSRNKGDSILSARGYNWATLFLRDMNTGTWVQEIIYFVINVKKTNSVILPGDDPATFGSTIGYWWESQKERGHWEDQDVGGWTILKWILER